MKIPFDEFVADAIILTSIDEKVKKHREKKEKDKKEASK
jgi:hypothetical protein